MTDSNHNDRTLAFKKSRLIRQDELKEISGGTTLGTISYSTKETFDTHGNYDVGADVQWD